MDTLALFGFSVAFSVTAWGVVTARYFWPMLRILPQRDALRLLLTLHAFRFVGLAFLVPGVVGPDLPAAFARPAAYGDLGAAILALLALAVLATSWGIAVVWLFNLWARSICSMGSLTGSSESVCPRVLGCRVLSYHSDCSAPLDHTRADLQAAPTTATVPNSAWVTACRRS